MKELFDKISSYHIFGYLFCGAVFAVLADKFLNYTLVQQNIVTGIFLYYFIGLVISKVGSSFVEPFLKKVFLPRDAREDVSSSATTDERVEILFKLKDTYRSLCALFLLLLILKLYETLSASLSSLAEWSSLLLMIFFLFFFLISYRKQMSDITKKVETRQ
jgi:hypothetical protein